MRNCSNDVLLILVNWQVYLHVDSWGETTSYSKFWVSNNLAQFSRKMLSLFVLST